MRNTNKKLMILLFVLMVILIICISIFIILNKNNKSTQNHTQYEDENIAIEYEEQGKYKPSVINNDYSIMSSEEINNLDENIDNIIGKINSRNYEELYYMVPTDDLNIKYNSFAEFKTFIDQLLVAKSYKCASYRIDDYNCYLKLIGDDKTGEKSLIELKIVNYKVQDGAKIHFENINNTKRTLTYIYASKVAFNMQYLVEYDDKMTVMFLIQNKNKEAKNIIIEELNLITIVNGQENRTISKKSESVVVPAIGKAKLEVLMDTDEKLMFLPEVMEMKVKIDGEEKQYRVQVVYPTI